MAGQDTHIVGQLAALLGDNLPLVDGGGPVLADPLQRSSGNLCRLALTIQPPGDGLNQHIVQELETMPTLAAVGEED